MITSLSLQVLPNSEVPKNEVCFHTFDCAHWNSAGQKSDRLVA